LVQGVSRLDSTELTTFFEKLNHAISGQQLPSPLDEEALLLKKIKTVMPASVIRRFKELQKKQYAYSISEKEQEEILAITDFIETKSADRIALLAALAKMRQMPLTGAQSKRVTSSRVSST
jgi:hypothetical protein